MVKTAKAAKETSKSSSKRKRPVARTPKTAPVKDTSYEISVKLADLLGKENSVFTEYTAILVRTNKTHRVLAKQVSEADARKAINKHWQYCQNPQLKHSYLLVSEDGNHVTSIPAGSSYAAAQASYEPKPLRTAIA